ncbi:F-box only protein 50-like isoform X2 [Halichoeres trimaculatus]|uniref:F-box only protein 50-like isoform X2 n=1 Tax=Halichoeres trimaculatus TaxID=147232 RepID=UPI003D9E8516
MQRVNLQKRKKMEGKDAPERDAPAEARGKFQFKCNPLPESDFDYRTRDGPPPREPQGDFSGWTTSTEKLPEKKTNIPPGAVVCSSIENSWFSMEQVVDLKAEGLWDELLDEFQPAIAIQDWYKAIQLEEHAFELHVKLLGADKSTVISEHSVQPTEAPYTESATWKMVSHMFSSYGPGVRYVHFKHRLKNMFRDGVGADFFQTLSSDSSVIITPNHPPVTPTNTSLSLS